MAGSSGTLCSPGPDPSKPPPPLSPSPPPSRPLTTQEEEGTSSAALLMGRVRHSSAKSEPTEGGHWEVTKLRKIVAGRVWARAPELSSLRRFRETARLLHLLMFRKLVGTGLFLSARGRLLFFLNQPGLNWTGWVNTVSSQAPGGPASQLSSIAGGPASPPSALLAVFTPCSLPRGSALSAPGSSSQKPGLPLAGRLLAPVCQLYCQWVLRPRPQPGFSLAALGLFCLLCPSCLLSPCSWEPACPTRPPPGTQAPAVCLLLAAVPRDPPPTSWAVLWSASRLR